MNIKIAFAALSGVIALAGCSTVPSRSPANEALAQTTLVNGTGATVGSAAIIGTGMAMRLKVSVAGQTPGMHGIHLHTTGQCDGPSFTSAGSHLNPTAHQHGSLNPTGPHLGDLPNIDVRGDGTGSIDVPLSADRNQMLAALFDSDGAAIVLHAGPDDYKTDPSGNSGGRIACGVMKSAQN